MEEHTTRATNSAIRSNEGSVCGQGRPILPLLLIRNCFSDQVRLLLSQHFYTSGTWKAFMGVC